MKSKDGVKISIHAFRSIIYEIIYLLDNNATIPRNTISKILDEGKDVFQYIEYTLPHRIDWTILSDETRELCLEILCRQHVVREKHAVAKNEGLLFLLNSCMQFTDPETLEAYNEIDIEYYTGKLSDERMWNLKFIGVRADEIRYY